MVILQVFRRSIHNNSLLDFDVDGHMYVVVLSVKVLTPFLTTKFIYPYFGADDPAETLVDLYQSGFYVWDLNMLRPVAAKK